jgi:hypothetical protein
VSPLPPEVSSHNTIAALVAHYGQAIAAMQQRIQMLEAALRSMAEKSNASQEDGPGKLESKPE